MDTALTTSPWHRGEQALQAHVGVAERMAEVGPRVIRDFMPDQHRQFYAQLPFIVVGAVDAQGSPWAGVIEGEPGFLRSPQPQRLVLGALPAEGDPVRGALEDGAPLGLLGIELHTRRRNRVNGRVAALHAGGFSLAVGESFGNCPRHIQQRGFRFARAPGSASGAATQHLQALDDEARARIAAADTFFVASHFPGDQQRPRPSVDVSHRGGKPGFVKVEGNLLTIPDFAGNLFFNTLGNLLLNPRAGLLFIDFETGELLQLSGHTTLVLDGPQLAAFPGAERLWTVRVEQLVRRRGALALRWS